MNADQLLESLSPELYQTMLNAVETGRWPNGERLTQQQKDHALQLTMLYQSRHNSQPQHMSVNLDGKIETKSKSELASAIQNNQNEIQRFK